jgi:CheY-like chemotaxis protein
LYSIEEICDAMITAGSAAALCRSEQDFLLCALQAAGELLEVSCVVFYPAPSSPFGHIGTLRVNQRAGSDLEIPESLPTTFSDYLRRQPRRIIVSGEWDALGTLLPSFDFSCCSSLWISLGNEDHAFGALAFFDHASRRFDRTQQKISELTAHVIRLGLESQAGRQTLQNSEAANYHEFSKLIGGVARDLINPLTAIFGYIELLKAESVEPRSAHLVTRMEEQIEKARRVIATFSSGSEIQKLRTGENPTVPRAELERPIASPKPKTEIAADTSMWQPASPEDNAGARILLVQRSEAVLEFQRSVLSALGVEVIPSLSASDALDHLRTTKMDAIVLDDELEEPLSSKRLVWWVRENRPELAERMLLTVSRKPSRETREILEIAMLPHVTKPLEVLELYSRAQQVLHSGKNPHLLQ